VAHTRGKRDTAMKKEFKELQEFKCSLFVLVVVLESGRAE
jgi:hypothetical protein